MPRATEKHIRKLIWHLRHAARKKMIFTFEGEQEVCCPKYLLVEDRDLIISLLEREFPDAVD
jgi:hypothetical protein